MNLIILDLEFNQFFEFPHTKIASDPKCPAEIIQIGAVKLAEDFSVMESKSFLVRPQIYTKMHPFVEKITGLSNELLKDNPHFCDVYDEFADFIGGDKTVFGIWGPDDMKELYKNILYFGLNGNKITKSYINIQRLTNSYLKNANTAIGLKTAVEALGLPIERPFHNALNDALYTADIIKIVARKEFENLSVSDFLSGTDIQKINISQLKQSIEAKINEINLKPLYDFAQGKLKRKLSERDKEAILAIYNAGHDKRFDSIKKSRNTTD